MRPIAIFLAEKLEDIVSNENWLLVNNAADELRRLQAKVDQLEAASKPWAGLTDEERRSLREWQKIQEELGPVWAPMMLYLYEAIEAKLKEKNT